MAAVAAVECDDQCLSVVRRSDLPNKNAASHAHHILWTVFVSAKSANALRTHVGCTFRGVQAKDITRHACVHAVSVTGCRDSSLLASFLVASNRLSPPRDFKLSHGVADSRRRSTGKLAGYSPERLASLALHPGIGEGVQELSKRVALRHRGRQSPTHGFRKLRPLAEERSQRNAFSPGRRRRL